MARSASAKPKLSLGLWLVWIFLPAAALAQARANEASLQVIVLDPAGAAIAKAQVRVQSGAGKEQGRATNQHGEAVFARLPAGEYQLIVEARGFNPHTVARLVLPVSENQLNVRLEVAPVNEQIEVAQEKREQQLDARSNAFSTVLTAEQIAQLPDDPEEFAAALRAMAGPGAETYVNGFRGGKLPPKSQISQIRFRLTPFAAENHNFGGTRVDIFTKPGVNQWHGGFNGAFRDEALNARNAFAPARGPEQMRRFAFDLSGPLWRNRTSLFLFADGVNSYDAKTIVAALPDGDFNSLIRRPSRRLNLSARLEHALSKTHTLRAEYQRNASRQNNLGAGDFDLPERAYSLNSVEHLLRVADSGPLTKRLVNEFRFQGRWQETASRALAAQPALIVPGAFHRGGAQLSLDRRAAEFEIADNLDLLFGNHGLRTGALLEITRQRGRELNNAHGAFIFASLDAFRAGRPTTFTQRVGEPEIRLTQYQLGWYGQDDWRVSQSFSFSFGLRHELQNHLRDRNNFAPRIGFAWSPFKRGRTALRGGAGIFYDWFGATTFEQALRVDGDRQRDLVVRNPGFPDPFAGSDVIVLPASRIVVDPQLRLPTIHRYSLSVQQQLTNRLNAHASYVYQRGAHLLRGRNLNAPLPGAGRPDPASGNLTQIEASANSFSHSLNTNLNWNQQWKSNWRVFLAANYTLAKRTDEASGPLSLPADNYDLRAERGPSANDTRHGLFMLSNLSAPKGLRLGALFSYTSAQPYNIITGFDDNGDTVINDRPAGVMRNSARGAAQWEMSARLSWSFGFGKPGNQAAQGGGRGQVVALQGDNALGGFSNLNETNKRFRTEYYLQTFNLFNRANLIGFSGVRTSPFFGRATGALPGRRIETGMRFGF